MNTAKTPAGRDNNRRTGDARPRSGIESLIDLAGHRSDDAVVTWQNLQRQCQQALGKLAALQQHRERYDDLMRVRLQQGMSAVATRAYLGFIRQIDDVITQQRVEVERIEAACVRQWQQVIEARREKRVFEVLGERVVAQELATALRASQREIENLLQRAASLPQFG